MPPDFYMFRHVFQHEHFELPGFCRECWLYMVYKLMKSVVIIRDVLGTHNHCDTLHAPQHPAAKVHMNCTPEKLVVNLTKDRSCISVAGPWPKLTPTFTTV